MHFLCLSSCLVPCTIRMKSVSPCKFFHLWLLHHFCRALLQISLLLPVLLRLSVLPWSHMNVHMHMYYVSTPIFRRRLRKAAVWADKSVYHMKKTETSALSATELTSYLLVLHVCAQSFFFPKYNPCRKSSAA